MQLGKSKPLSWYTEIFSSSYFKTHVFTSVFIYGIFLIILLAVINEIKTFSFISFLSLILKVLISFIVIYLLKLFFERYNI